LEKTKGNGAKDHDFSWEHSGFEMSIRHTSGDVKQAVGHKGQKFNREEHILENLNL
jgi:hypothetical protein